MQKFVQNAVLLLINIYRKYFSYIKLQRTCRFYPSCSDYAYESVKKYGTIKGLSKAMVRIVRCNPLSSGGYDPV